MKIKSSPKVVTFLAMLCGLALSWAAPCTITGQNLGMFSPPPKTLTNLYPAAMKPTGREGRLSSRLRNRITETTRARTPAGTAETTSSTRLRVMLEFAVDTPPFTAALAAHGATVIGQYEGRLAVEMESSKVVELMTDITAIDFARLPYRFATEELTSEGTALTGAPILHNIGITGASTRIAVIDVGFMGMTAAQQSGDLPAGLFTQDFTGKGLQTQYLHGTGCAEIVHDMAPAAELHLLKIADEIDLAAAFTYCVDNGIDIISFSLGTHGSGPGDGTGELAEAIDELRAKGILFVTAAGNEATFTSGGIKLGSHWQGPFLDSGTDRFWGGVNNDLHQFIVGDASSYLNAIIAYPTEDDDGTPETDEVSITLSWDDWPLATVDYDLYLFNYDTAELVAWSNTPQTGSQPPVESIVLDVPDSVNGLVSYALFVVKPDGEPAGHDLELFLSGTSSFVAFDKYSEPIATSGSSLSEPADARSALAVGAVSYHKWTTGPQEEFSSRGPTNGWNGSGERIKPDISGPDGVSTTAYGTSAFFGTSAATPHVAGAAALLLEMHPTFGPDQLQTALEGHATDMGANGKDNIYGAGRLSFDAYSSPPVLEPIGSRTFPEGNTLAVTPAGWTNNGDLIFTIAGLPNGAVFTAEPPSFSWTPAFNQAGVYEGIRFTVTDAGGSASEEITLTVTDSVDIDGNGDTGLADAIAVLQLSNATGATAIVSAGTDINGDHRIGMAEALHILRLMAFGNPLP